MIKSTIKAHSMNSPAGAHVGINLHDEAALTIAHQFTRHSCSSSSCPLVFFAESLQAVLEGSHDLILAVLRDRPMLNEKSNGKEIVIAIVWSTEKLSERSTFAQTVCRSEPSKPAEGLSGKAQSAWPVTRRYPPLIERSRF